MQNNVKVSIILPIYNSENTLRRCIDSVVAQNQKNIELICVDDGSWDHSSEICAEYIKKCDNMLAIRLLTQKNQGVVVARANGIKKARGDGVPT